MYKKEMTAAVGCLQRLTPLCDTVLRERWGKWWGRDIKHIKPLSSDSNRNPDFHWIMHALPVITLEEGGDK